MSESICNIIPTQQEKQDIRIVHFVYETDFHKLPQPFFPLIHYLYIVTAGNGTLRTGDKTYALTEGSIFFAFPARQFTLKGSKDFRYIYISFMGADAQKLLEEMHITPHYPTYLGHKDLCEMFYRTVKSSNARNAAMIAQGLLYYTLTQLRSDAGKKEKSEQMFAAVLHYVEHHYADPTLSLTTLARISSYTEKYISALFVKQKKVSFRTYLVNLRIVRAKELLTMDVYSVGQVARLCGFSDPLYFSKVFKKETGWTPTALKQRGIEHR